jgi:hypothetical protein
MNAFKGNKHLNNKWLTMILFVHFTLNDLTKIDLIIWMQKKKTKSNHKIRK